MVRVLPIHFGMVLGCQGGGGKNLFRSRKVFSGAGLPNRAKGQIFHHGRAWKVILAWYSVAKEAGGTEKLSGPESLFLDLGARNKAAQARQAKTSQHKPRAASEVRWPSVSPAGVWLKLSTSAWWPRKNSNLPGAAPCLSSAWKFRAT